MSLTALCILIHFEFCQSLPIFLVDMNEILVMHSIISTQFLEEELQYLSICLNVRQKQYIFTLILSLLESTNIATISLAAIRTESEKYKRTPEELEEDAQHLMIWLDTEASILNKDQRYRLLGHLRELQVLDATHLPDPHLPDARGARSSGRYSCCADCRRRSSAAFRSKSASEAL